MTVSDAVPSDLSRVARELRRAGPMPIVFATASFGALLDNWLAHAGRAGVSGVLVIALDEATQGADFIHSDLDAVWLADPRPECFAEPSFDAVFSQGTYHPEQAHAAWGFVLCCGLFAIRPRSASANFLAAVRSRGRTEGNDRAALNLVLLENGMTWSGNPAMPALCQSPAGAWSAIARCCAGESSALA